MKSVFAYLLTFLAGIGAKWFQDVLHDRKQERRALNEGILRPIRSEVHTAIAMLEAGDRVTSVDLSQWDRIVAAGREQEMTDELRTTLEQLYKRELPAHDRSWLAANEEIASVMELADRNFGGQRASIDIPLAPWRKFVTGRTFKPELIGWHSGPVRIWNKQLEPARLLPLHGSREDLLRRIWTEGQMRPTINQHTGINASCLECANRALTQLDAAIRTRSLAWVPKSVRNILGQIGVL